MLKIKAFFGSIFFTYLDVQTNQNEGMKVTHSEKKTTAFGGLNFCHELFKKSGLTQLIDKHLGVRVKTVGFDYSDILSTHMSVFLARGDCTEDANEHFAAHSGRFPTFLFVVPTLF